MEGSRFRFKNESVFVVVDMIEEKDCGIFDVPGFGFEVTILFETKLKVKMFSNMLFRGYFLVLEKIAFFYVFIYLKQLLNYHKRN